MDEGWRRLPPIRFFPHPPAVGNSNAFGISFAAPTIAHLAALSPQNNDGTRPDTIYMIRNTGCLLPGNNVLGRIKRCVDPASPGFPFTHRREFEVKRFPKGIEGEVDKKTFSA